MPKTKTSFRPGRSGNPGGMTTDMRKARDELNAALAGHRGEVHQALMRLVRDGNVQAVLYAHQRLAGKLTTTEDEGTTEQPLSFVVDLSAANRDRG